MSGARVAALTAVMAAGVLLPKAVPAALLGTRLHPAVDRFLHLVPAAVLGGLVIISVAGTAGVHRRAAAAVAVVVAAAMAVLTRRSLLAMASGWAAVAAGLALSG